MAHDSVPHNCTLPDCIWQSYTVYAVYAVCQRHRLTQSPTSRLLCTSLASLLQLPSTCLRPVAGVLDLSSSSRSHRSRILQKAHDRGITDSCATELPTHAPPTHAPLKLSHTRTPTLHAPHAHTYTTCTTRAAASAGDQGTGAKSL